MIPCPLSGHLVRPSNKHYTDGSVVRSRRAVERPPAPKREPVRQPRSCRRHEEQRPRVCSENSKMPAPRVSAGSRNPSPKGKEPLIVANQFLIIPLPMHAGRRRNVHEEWNPMEKTMKVEIINTAEGSERQRRRDPAASSRIGQCCDQQSGLLSPCMLAKLIPASRSSFAKSADKLESR